jgi:hypothetical protein
MYCLKEEARRRRDIPPLVELQHLRPAEMFDFPDRTNVIYEASYIDLFGGPGGASGRAGPMR